MIKRSLVALLALSAPAAADPVTVQNVNVVRTGDTYTFNVTIRHTDTGWEDYADSWRIKDMSGTILGERALAHPHVDEQPFTRSLSGVKIPAGVDKVVIEAHDTVNGWASGEKVVTLP
jgi:hypothetical protein